MLQRRTRHSADFVPYYKRCAVNVLSSEMNNVINIGLLGLGVVGSSVAKTLRANAALLNERLGVRLNVCRVAVRRADQHRAVTAPVTTEWREVTRDPNIPIVVELIGGCDTARAAILDALRLGKTVVTANKALLAEHGDELFRVANQHRAHIFFEASVCGGIPIIKILREGLVANRFDLIYGIVNGTCNYIFTRMTEDGIEFGDALGEAQRRGYAEADPSLDIRGVDAAHKATILASLAHGFWTGLEHSYAEGIRHVTQLDIQIARELGYRIKQLAIIKRSHKKGAIEVRVHPTLIPQNHVLASVNGAFNAIVVRGDVVGDTMFYGRGAGGGATASAVIADLADAALALKNDRLTRPPLFISRDRAKILPIDDVESRYYLRLTVADRAGVIAKVAKILGDAHISIASVLQPETPEPKRGQKPSNHVPLIMMLHTARDRAVRNAVARIDRLNAVRARTEVIRVENFN
jgi:homoserine dehydrogenase